MGSAPPYGYRAADGVRISPPTFASPRTSLTTDGINWKPSSPMELCFV